MELILEDAVLPMGTTTSLQCSLHVDSGTIMAVMGASGAGKTSLLHAIAGFRLPTHGRIWINKQDVTNRPPHQRPVGMIFQEHNLFPYLTVADNIGIGIRPSLRLTALEKQHVDTALADVGLEGRGDCYPHMLSGGQKQRVALARVLVRDVSILLLDEPFSSLDPGLRYEMIALLQRLRSLRHFTMLLVTHNPQDAHMLCPKTAFLADGQVAHVGETNTILQPTFSDAVHRYLGDVKAS